MRIAVYCGSFAPVHYGHIKIARETIEDDLADQVLIVPTGDYWDKKIAIPLNERIKCLKLFEDETIKIDSDIEDCKAPNTYTLLERLKTKYPHDELILLIGADNLLEFEKWVNYQYLLDNYRFIIMRRHDVDVDKEMQRLHKSDYDVIDCPKIDISSSYIREHLQDIDLIKDKISPEVLAVIRKYLD